MKKAALIPIFLMSVILILAGCANTSRRDNKMGSSSALETQAILKFADIPVPSGFKFCSDESYSFEASQVRVGVLKYKGKAEPELVLTFYKEQMPMYNWNLLNITEYGDRLMNFDRDNETCIISLSSHGNYVTAITISVGPKAQSSARKKREPLK